jgi:hypothetical protein
MDESTKQNFTFINLSHPDDLKDQNTIDHVRTAAMTNFGRKRRKPKVGKEKNQMVFEVRTPETVVAGPASLSSYGAERLDLVTFGRNCILDPRTRQILENGQFPAALHAYELSIPRRTASDYIWRWTDHIFFTCACFIP